MKACTQVLVLHLRPLAQLEERPEVVDVRMNAAGRDEPEQVHVAVTLPGALERADERVVLE